MEKLIFNLDCCCDSCNRLRKCARTSYGTTNYTRLICEECATEINQQVKTNGEEEVFNLNTESKK